MFEGVALLMLDWQRDICTRGGRMVGDDETTIRRFDAARATMAKVLTFAREGDRIAHRIHVRHQREPGTEARNAMERYADGVGAFTPGDAGTQIVEELQPVDGELLLVKHTISAFESTDLVRRLTRRGINRVVIGGVVTHYAVLVNAFAAGDRGFAVTVLKDCCTSGSLARHETALEILRPFADVQSATELMTGVEP